MPPIKLSEIPSRRAQPRSPAASTPTPKTPNKPRPEAAEALSAWDLPPLEPRDQHRSVPTPEPRQATPAARGSEETTYGIQHDTQGREDKMILSAEPILPHATQVLTTLKEIDHGNVGQSDKPFRIFRSWKNPKDRLSLLVAATLSICTLSAIGLVLYSDGHHHSRPKTAHASTPEFKAPRTKADLIQPRPALSTAMVPPAPSAIVTTPAPRPPLPTPAAPTPAPATPVATPARLAPPPTTRLAQIVCLAPNEVPAAKSHPATHRTLFAATIWWDAAEFAHALKASAKEWTGNRNVMILFDTKPQSLVIDPPADIEVLGFDQRARMTAKWNDPSDHVWLAGAATEIAKFQKQTCALQVITGN